LGARSRLKLAAPLRDRERSVLFVELN